MRVQLLIGLGNPGRKYRKTRHNIGFVILDRLAGLNGFEIKKKKFKSQFELTELFGKKLCLIKPLTFMNLSGQAVGSFMDYFKCPAADILIVHDDIDLPLGKLRFARDSGHGGHNGIRSIIDTLGTKEFCRLKFGIGRPPEGVDPADYVLTPFAKSELEFVDEAAEKAVLAIKAFYETGSV